MCGICGRVNRDTDKDVSQSEIKQMCDVMSHRGPDDAGYYLKGNVGLGHRRLSIIDLSSGHQPLSNEDETIWIVFNGEIYNYQELKRGLESKGHSFRTNSDTEVIIHNYEEKGIASLEDLRGMFAFALWDARKKTLFVARDRVGIKPLYYTVTKSGFLFASEVKSLLTQSDVTREPNVLAQMRFLTFNYTPGEETVFKDVYKLPPGNCLVYENNTVKIQEYWNIDYRNKISNYNESVECRALDKLMQDTMRLHMISDVPVGFLLSGGVDSTALLSFAVEQTDKKVSTFTIGFEGQGFADERPYAKLAADRFGTSHYEQTITHQQFADFLPKYIWHMEEPVCEPPAIALYYITKLASEHVKVLISGEGGDEAFGGYQNYRNELLVDKIKMFGGPLAKPLLSALSKVGGAMGERFGQMSRDSAVDLEKRYFSRASVPDRLFNTKMSHLFGGQLKNIGWDKILSPLNKLFIESSATDKLDKMLYVDLKTWLPDDLLIKADKITMANSVELRVPLLDHVLLEYAATLPQNAKIDWFKTKKILKKTFERKVPVEIIRRKKTGFPVPYSSWLKNEMSEMVNDILLSETALQRGIMPRVMVVNMIDTHKKSGSLGKELFMLLVLELWHKKFM